MPDITTFTIKYDTIVDRLIFPCVIAHKGVLVKTHALIDTGASLSYVSEGIFTKLNLLKTGREIEVITSKSDGFYPIVMAEYFGVPKDNVFNNCTFIAKPFPDKSFDIILGMDFLCKGDFVISNADNHTTVTICRPSQSIIKHSDNIVYEKDIPQLIKLMQTLPFDILHIDTTCASGYNENTIV